MAREENAHLNKDPSRGLKDYRNFNDAGPTVFLHNSYNILKVKSTEVL